MLLHDFLWLLDLDFDLHNSRDLNGNSFHVLIGDLDFFHDADHFVGLGWHNNLRGALAARIAAVAAFLALAATPLFEAGTLSLLLLHLGNHGLNLSGSLLDFGSAAVTRQGF